MRAFPLLLALMLLALVPPGAAHVPPGPVTTCQPSSGAAYHDYLLANPHRVGLLGADGNQAVCAPNSTPIRPLDENRAACLTLAATYPPLHGLLCNPHYVSVGQPAFDYDGELDHGYGGVILAAETGDGATYGSQLCYGMQGHHHLHVFAEEMDGSGPAFTVAADYGSPWEPCGDGIVEPCGLPPPPPSAMPFPVNLVLDIVNQALWTVVYGPAPCNPLDQAGQNGPTSSGTRSDPLGPTDYATPFPPGRDGAYLVFLEADPHAPDAPLAGHVWTSLVIAPAGTPHHSMGTAYAATYRPSEVYAP